MLVTTGVIGWTISSAAQIVGIAGNSKISKEQKDFLIPQELYDAVTNILTFFLITTLTRKSVEKLFKTGKWMPSKLKSFLKGSDIYSNKIGKHNFDIGKLKELPSNIKNEYEITKSFGTLIATTGAGIVATNIVTPIVRNKKAAKIQKALIEFDKDEKAKEIDKPNNTSAQSHPTFNSLHTMRLYGSSSMKI